MVKSFKNSFFKFCRAFFLGLGILFFLSICAQIFLIVYTNRAFKIKPKTALHLALDTALFETRPTDFLSSVAFGNSPTMLDLVLGLDRAKKDNNIVLLTASLTDTNLSLAQIQEVRNAVIDFRTSGKKAVLYAPSFGELGQGLKTYYLATAFDEIWLQPTGEVGLNGFFMEMPFLKQALKKIGVAPDFKARYEFKAGADTIAQSKMSEPERKNLNALLESFLNQIGHDIALARKFKPDQAKDIILSGPYFAYDALKLGLVDYVEYTDVFTEKYKTEFDERVDLFDYALITQPKIKSETPIIAYIPAVGLITFGDSVFAGNSDASLMGATSVSDALRQAADDKSVKAIVVRIDSPGGGYIPSDMLRQELLFVKKASNKPIICSMSSTAASGGYFMALGCDKIVADPATITGSIGVFGGKLVFKELAKRLDVNIDTIKMGKNAGMLSSFEPFSKEQNAFLNKAFDRVYNDFTLKVATARGLTLAQVDKIARGRVFSGKDALSHNLVDQLGGLKEALDLAWTHTGEKTQMKVVEYPLAPTRLEMMMQFVESGSLNVFSKPATVKGYLPKMSSWIERLNRVDAMLYAPLTGTVK